MKLLPAAALACSLVTPALADSQDDQLHTIQHFFENATVVSGPTIVDCTLSGRTQTTCFSITVKAEPQSYTPGPWCPTSINDSADDGGIWLQDGQVNDVDGDFISGLATFYGDDTWQLFERGHRRGARHRYQSLLRGCSPP